MSNIVTARGLAKSYGKVQALSPTDLDIPAGRVVGIIGANGAGKTTMLNALLGLHSYDGSLAVMGRDPYKVRHELMEDVSFISDVATLPRWMKVRDVMAYVASVHPNFDLDAAAQRLAQTHNIKPNMRVKSLSKGMIVQVHLAIVLAIDAKLLVLDEPTLGLDVINRRAFYDALIEEFFDHERSVIVTTHQVEEIEAILTHVVFLREGKKVLDCAVDDLGNRFALLEVTGDTLDAAKALGPISSRTGLGRTTMLFDGIERSKLETLGDVRRASLTDIFIAKMKND